jgi:acyl-coenzyme A thioesterase PaaI-like protein
VPAQDGAAAAIRDRVLRALVANRTPGFHFPGHFIGVQWREVGSESARLEVPDGAHVRDAGGNYDFAVLAVVADVALGTAARLPDPHHERQATVQLQLQLTGSPARGDLQAAASWLGSTDATRCAYSLTETKLVSRSKTVAYARGQFVRLGSPPGVALAPLPWQRGGAAAASEQQPPALASYERGVVGRCDEALARAGGALGFIHAFWGGEGRRTARGATRRLAVALHVGNRVGHVQGGVLLAFAAACAADVVPGGWALSNATVWYLRPGTGSGLTARAMPVRLGNKTALVRTRITDSDGTHVTETMTQHVLEEAQQ